MNLLATNTPTAIPGTADDTKYLVQNKSTNHIRVLGATSAPDPDDANAYELGHRDFLGVELETGESIFCWTITGSAAVAANVYAE